MPLTPMKRSWAASRRFVSRKIHRSRSNRFLDRGPSVRRLAATTSVCPIPFPTVDPRTSWQDREVRAPAIAFDLDDTITDWWTAISDAAERVTDRGTAQQLCELVRHEVWERRADAAVHRAHWRLRAEAVGFWRCLLTHAEAEVVAGRFLELLRPRPYHDVAPTLRDLAPHADLAVLTNSPYADEELDAMQVASYFSAIVALADPIRKPHPEAFETLCRQLDRSPEEIWHVGDSPLADVEPAREHGISAVWIDRFGDDWSVPEDVVHVRSLAELPDLVRAHRS